MNVAGLPGLESAGPFWLVILGLVATAAATPIFLSRRRMI
jgi:Mg2+ and Co2+ transporter CorA